MPHPPHHAAPNLVWFVFDDFWLLGITLFIDFFRRRLNLLKTVIFEVFETFGRYTDFTILAGLSDCKAKGSPAEPRAPKSAILGDASRMLWIPLDP